MFNENIPENFFNITLSQQGAATLLRFNKIVRWLFILVTVVAVILLINAGIKYRLYMRYSISTWFSFFQLKVFPIAEIVMVVISVVQNYYLFSFARENKNSIELQHTDQFNESFKWLLKAAVVAGLLAVLQFVFMVLILYGDFELLTTLH